MEIKARYAVIGLFMIAVTAAAFAFVYWLENRSGLGQRVSYEVEFPGPVSGLLTGSAVLFNGLRVGEVTGLRLSPDNPRAVHAVIGVDAATPVRADTRVSVEFQGLTGVPAVTLTGGSATAPLAAPEPGRLPRLVAESAAGQSLTDAARQMMARIDGVIDANSGNLSEMIANLNEFAKALGRNADKVDGVMAGLERLTGGGSRSTIPAYDLAALAAPPTPLKPLGKQLAVLQPTALLAFDSDRILGEGENGELTPLDAAKWPDNLPVLLQTRLVQSFENSGALSEANRPVDGLSADYQLLTEIRRFQLAAGAKPAAHVEISAKLLTADGHVAAVRVFSGQAPANSLSPPDVIAAFNAAFRSVAAELVNWTAGVIAAADGASEPAEAVPRGPA